MSTVPSVIWHLKDEMRVITGIAKGKRLVAPKGLDIRPTADRVKEALFNVLGGIEGAKVLDLYAGSGSLGIESLSRGAKFAVFVDRSLSSIQAIQKNLKNTGFLDQAKILRSSVKKALKVLSKGNFQFSLIFVDPPYKINITEVKEVLEGLAWGNLLEHRGKVVLEHSFELNSIFPISGLKKDFDRSYGDTYLTFCEGRKEDEEGNLSGKF